MGFNKKALSKIKADLNSAKAPAQPRDIIYDPMGQWKHPGQPTRIPGGNITMQGVSYPVMAYPNVGQPQMMYPNQDYVFPEADYVDEYPQMKKGGSKKFTRNIRATNKLFTKNPYLKKQKLSKRKVFDPTSAYYQRGGYLPKAQDGLLNLRDAKVEVVPFSYNYSNPQGQTIWGKPYPQEPTYRVGIEAPIKKPNEGYHTLNLDVGLPYSDKLKPSTELRYDWYNKPSLGSMDVQLPYVQMTGRAGYDPVEKGFAGASARTYYGFGTARPQTKSRPAQFRKNTWWGTLGPALDFNLGDMQMVEHPESREKRFMIDPEWAYGLRGDVEYRPGRDKNLRLGARYALMFDPIEGKNMEMLGYKPNSEDRLQFSTNPSLEVYGTYGVDLEPNFKKRPTGKLTDVSKTTGTSTQNNTGNTVIIDDIPVEQNIEPCPEGYRRDRPDGECVPIERHHHPRWLKEGGKLGPIPINSGRKVLRDWTYGKTIGMLQEQDGGSTFTTQLSPEEEAGFQNFYRTLPENLQQDDPSYDIRGYWDSEGRPGSFNYDQPKEDDGYYHAYSINQNTGEYLKSPWHETFQHAVDEDRKIGWRPITNVQGRNVATENPSIASPEEQSFLRNTEGPVNDYIETELTPEEIRVYREGGYIVEELD